MNKIEERAKEYVESLRKDDEYLHVPDVEVMSVEECEDFWMDTFIEISKIQREADINDAVSLAAEIFSRPTMKNFDKALDDFRHALEL